MNLIEHVSNKGKTCVYHSHVPAIDVSKVGNPGAPRITDVGLMNTCKSNIVFGTANVMSFTVLRTLGDINSNPYGPEGDLPSPYNTEGPTMPKFGDMLSVDVHLHGNSGSSWISYFAHINCWNMGMIYASFSFV